VGKGDKRSKRGKINRGTFGKRRRRKTQTYKPAPVTEEKTKKTEVKETDEPVVTEVKAEKKKTTRKKTTKKDTDKEKE